MPSAAAGDTIIYLPGPPGSQSYTVHIDTRSPDWTDPSIYAPALPGVIVALLGLYIAHRLSWRRERRREVLELKNSLQKALSDAEVACCTAWTIGRGLTRATTVLEAKSKLQDAGILATELERKSKQRIWGSLCHVISNRPMSVDVIGQIADLRELATSDPFEIPNRSANVRRAEDIRALVRQMQAVVDHQFFAIFG